MVLSKEEISAFDWNSIGSEELMELCRNWNGEILLFSGIINCSIRLLFLNTKDLADRIGGSREEVDLWLKGEDLPDPGWMLLILTDIIQVELEVLSGRARFGSPPH